MARKKKQPSFKELQAHWYKKLEKSGFVDIEKKETNLRTYRYRNDEGTSNQFTSTWRNSKMEYYSLATQFLNEHEFQTNIEKVIWEYHTNGISVRNITNLLSKAKLSQTNRTYVWFIVRDLRKIMKEQYLKK